MSPSSFRHRALAIGLSSALSATLLLGGCTGARYRRPDVPVPPSYRGEDLAPGSSGAANHIAQGSFGELRWQELIRDEELSSLIREALAHNLDVQLAAARVLEARAQLALTRADRFPSIDVAQNEPPILLATLSWELDLWGRIRNANAAARANLLASQQARRVVLQTLVSDVAAAYFLLRDLDREVEITRRALAFREDSLQLVQLRVDNGYSSEIDLRQAEVLVKTARAALTEIYLETEQAENQLAILLGRNPGPIVRSVAAPEPELVPRLPSGLPSTLLDRRPDIGEAEQQLIASHALVAVAKAAYFPTLSLTANSGFESSALHNLLSLSNSTWYFGPVGSLPLFNAGRIQAGVRGAEARRQEAMILYRKTVQQAFHEVADGLAAARRLAELRTEQEGLVESLHEAVELADLRYRGGIASYLEYLDSERQLLDAQLLLVQIRRQELINTVTLYRSLGGGWQ